MLPCSLNICHAPLHCSAVSFLCEDSVHMALIDAGLASLHTWLCPYYIHTWLNSSCAWVFHRQHCLHTCCCMIMEFFAFTVYGHSIHFFVNYMAKCSSKHCVYIVQLPSVLVSDFLVTTALLYYAHTMQLSVLFIVSFNTACCWMAAVLLWNQNGKLLSVCLHQWTQFLHSQLHSSLQLP